MKAVAIVLFTALVIISGFFYFNSKKTDSGEQIAQSTARNNSIQDNPIQNSDAPKTSVLAKNLEIPWALTFLPDKSILFTERVGRVRVIDSVGKLKNESVYTVPDIKLGGEGGLLGITVSPNFVDNNFVYIYYTFDNEKTLNRVVRFKYINGSFVERKVIVDNIPGATNHNGGRLKFGPDKFLYITTGDSLNPSLSQDKNSLAGKILRVSEDGSIPADNPFNSAVYSYGHRNPQGLTWDDTGRLWETEHGNNAHDEVNIIEKGKNYGWPDVIGDQKKSGINSPVVQSGNDTWAPSGVSFLDGSIYYAGLRGNALFQAKINGDKVSLSNHFKGEFGRLREVVVGPDNLLYILTSNRDGRGSPDSTDDRIIVVNPKLL